MNADDIKNLLENGIFPHHSRKRTVIETHISYVILCDNYVYKIKKAKKFSFLDFSDLSQRKYYCEREIKLNSRFAPDVYIKTVAISKKNNLFYIENEANEIVEYAVKMRRLDSSKQMDKLLIANKITPIDIDNLARKVAEFHKSAEIITHKNFEDLYTDFNDIKSQIPFIETSCGSKFATIIKEAIRHSDNFLDQNRAYILKRLHDGWFRDCHGDLHTRNIFILPRPIPFDCIEFNDDFRYIDVLNEIAFLCMDLDTQNRKDLSKLFAKKYFEYMGIAPTPEEKKLFLYYKMYRANVRAKVMALKAADTDDNEKKEEQIVIIKKFLNSIEDYLEAMIRAAS